MLTISFFLVVFPVALQSAVLVTQQRILGSVTLCRLVPAALTFNTAFGDPGDDRACVDLH